MICTDSLGIQAGGHGGRHPVVMAPYWAAIAVAYARRAKESDETRSWSEIAGWAGVAAMQAAILYETLG